MMKTELLLRKLLEDSVKPNNLNEVALLIDYMNEGCKYGDPIFLSLGESWQGAPKELISYLGQTPEYTHGYLLSMYGLPSARKAVKEYLVQDYNISQNSFEVALSWTGTRSAMLDYGKLLVDEYFVDDQPQLIMAAPGFDYDNIYRSIGYQTSYVELNERSQFAPDIAKFEQAIKSLKNRKGLVVINAQHNPTSVNWGTDFVRKLVRLCLERSIAILIDDAFYGVYFGFGKPTSTLSILLEESNAHSGSSPPWFLTRTFGKQYSIHGWAIGAIASDAKTLDRIVNKYRPEHTYNTSGPFQSALERWLKSGRSEKYLQIRNQGIERKKGYLKNTFVNEFGYKEEAVLVGECTPFVLLKVPQGYQKYPNGVRSFLGECIRYGIILSEAFPKPLTSSTKKHQDMHYVRIYAGVPQRTLTMLVARLKKHQFNYGMQGFKD